MFVCAETARFWDGLSGYAEPTSNPSQYGVPEYVAVYKSPKRFRDASEFHRDWSMIARHRRTGVPNAETACFDQRADCRRFTTEKDSLAEEGGFEPSVPPEKGFLF